MLGHRWESAEATVIDKRIVRFAPVGAGYSELPVHEFVVEVHRADGETFRARVQEKQGKILPPDVRAVVGVRVDPKSAEVVFDDDDPRLNLKSAARGYAGSGAGQVR